MSKSKKMGPRFVATIQALNNYFVSISMKVLPERLFLCVFVAFGLSFVFIVPPFQNPDEPMHFYRSYQVSELRLAPSGEGADMGGGVDRGLIDLVNNSNINSAYDYSFKFPKNPSYLSEYRYTGDPVMIPFPNSAVYSPLLYIPQSLALGISNTFDLPILLSLYLGRTLCLLLVALAIFYAIRIVPFGKWVFAVVGILPMSIAGAASLGADAVTMSVTYVFVALVLSMSFAKTMPSRSRWLMLAAMVVCLGLIKQSHIALLPLVALIPLINHRSRSKKAYVLLGSSVVLSVLAFGLWYVSVAGVVLTPDASVDPLLQKAYVMHDPLGFVLGPLASAFLTADANPVLISFFGNFGWLVAPLPLSVIILSAVILLGSIFMKDHREMPCPRFMSKNGAYLRGVLAVAFLGVFLLTALSLYLYWTPYKLPTVLGLQGRYLVPIIPLVLLILFRSSAAGIGRRLFLVIGGSVLVLVVSLTVIAARFYTI